MTTLPAPSALLVVPTADVPAYEADGWRVVCRIRSRFEVRFEAGVYPPFQKFTVRPSSGAERSDAALMARIGPLPQGPAE